MAESVVRVALLARAGKARDQLHRALSEAGAEIVAEGDPAELDPAQVASRSPTVYLVSLEPATEAGLDRFDELLAAPGVEIMFDDAEVTAKLDGWDLNRWARHVTSKLLGSAELPPVPAGSPEWLHADLTDDRPPPTPAQLMDGARLEDYTSDVSELADSVPVSPSLMPDNPDLGLDFDPDLLELDFSSSPSQSSPPTAGPFDGVQEPELYGELDLAESVSFASFTQEESTLGDLDADVAELAAQLEAFESTDQRFAAFEASAAPSKPSEVEAEHPRFDSVPAAATAAAPAARGAVNFDFSNLALAPIDGAQEPAAAIVPAFASARASAPATSLELSLDELPTATTAPAGGAVVILAGLGGPDAVRQLLSSLPEKLSVPVLLYQHLEVGKHARLVEQLAKISRLPVVLARDGATPQGGHVTLLPAGMTAMGDSNALVFGAGTLAQMLSALPAADSMVVVLSGADPQLVPQILSIRDAGGLVLAQDPEVCFDATAAEAMQRQGAAVYPALGLARQIAGRWSL